MSKKQEKRPRGGARGGFVGKDANKMIVVKEPRTTAGGALRFDAVLDHSNADAIRKLFENSLLHRPTPIGFTPQVETGPESREFVFNNITWNDLDGAGDAIVGTDFSRLSYELSRQRSGLATLQVTDPEPATSADVMRDLLALANVEIAIEDDAPEEPTATERTGLRHIALGFTGTPEAKEAEAFNVKEEAARVKREARNKEGELRRSFKVRYPMHSFLTEADTTKLCQTYSLALVEAERYIGEIPEHCLRDIESFGLREEDKRWWVSALNGNFLTNSRCRIWSAFANEEDANQFYSGLPGGSERSMVTSNRLSILAPADKVKLNYGERVSGSRVVKGDPIVLCPVDGGYLVVTAWGDEANDSAVANENRN